MEDTQSSGFSRAVENAPDTTQHGALPTLPSVAISQFKNVLPSTVFQLLLVFSLLNARFLRQAGLD